MKRYLITKWLGVDVIHADSFRITKNGTEFYIDEKLIATTSSKDVKEIPNDQTVYSLF